MLLRAYVYGCPHLFSPSVFTSSNFLLLEENLGDLGLYVRAGDLLMVASDLASELQLALACLVDQLIDSAPGQEAADLHLALLTQAVGTILAVLQVSQLECCVAWGEEYLRLDIVLWVVRLVEQNNLVGGCQVDARATSFGRQ